MTEREFQKLRARKGIGIVSTLGKSALKSEVGDSGEVRDVEPSAGHESLAAQRLALSYTGRPVVRFKVFRKRLTDMPRSDCEKYYIDGLRYAGLIQDDSAKQIQFKDEGHEQVGSTEEERVEINIEYESVDLNNPWRKA